MAGFETGADIYGGLKALDTRSANDASILALGYVMGVADQLEAQRSICYPGKTTVSQVAKISENYLGQHPESWSAEASIAVAASLIAVWPCLGSSK